MPDGFDTGGFRSQQRFNDSDTGPVERWSRRRAAHPAPAGVDSRDTADRLPAAGAADLGTAGRAAHLERPDGRAAAAPDRPPPSAGWRQWLYLASFKTINLGDSPRVAITTIWSRRPIDRCRVATGSR